MPWLKSLSGQSPDRPKHVAEFAFNRANHKCRRRHDSRMPQHRAQRSGKFAVLDRIGSAEIQMRTYLDRPPALLTTRSTFVYRLIVCSVKGFVNIQGLINRPGKHCAFSSVSTEIPGFIQTGYRYFPGRII